MVTLGKKNPVPQLDDYSLKMKLYMQLEKVVCYILEQIAWLKAKEASLTLKNILDTFIIVSFFVLTYYKESTKKFDQSRLLSIFQYVIT